MTLTPLWAATALGPGRQALLALAGVGAGAVNGVAGGGTLVSFPTMIAMGYPALTANVRNTVGIWPGYVSGVAGFHRQVADQGSLVRALAWPSGIGALAGAILLLLTPSGDFKTAAPWLILFASVLFALQPLLARWLVGGPHRAHRLPLHVGTLLCSVYGGYFGAGLGVMLLAVLGLALPDTLARTSGLRAVLSVLVNGVAALVFVVHSPLVWQAVALLATGSLVGGWLGARLALRIPVPALRTVVVLVGLATAARLFAG
jgi:uncharacterized protein